jgi:Family of unknown function (DUF5309)
MPTVQNADYASLSSALATLFQDKVVSQFQRATPLLHLLPFEPSQGKNVQWDVNTGTVPADLTIGDGTDVVDFYNDTLTPASLNLGSYHSPFSITLFAIAAAQRTNNPAEIAALYEHKLMGAVTRLAKNINKELYLGTGATNHVMGLLDATSGGLISTGTYAGIDRGSVSQWAGNEIANSGAPRPLDVSLMRDTVRQIYQASGEQVDLIVCDPFQHMKYGQLIDPFRRWMENVTLRGEVKLDAGYKALEFDGIPVIMDPDCPAGKMVFLNTKYVKVRQMPFPPQNPSDPFAHGVVRLKGTPEFQFGDAPSSLEVGIQELTRSGTARKFQLYMWPQLQVERPNACAVLEDLATS